MPQAKYLALLLAAVASSALAQSVPLQSGAVTPGHAPMYVNQGSGQPIVTDGGGAANGAVGKNLSELGITARSANNSYPVANGGKGALNAHFCLYDAPSTNPTGYHYLCLDPNSQGGGLLSYGASGTATPLPLYFDINGVTTVPGGTSTLITVGSTVVNGGTSGQLLYNNAGVLGGMTLGPGVASTLQTSVAPLPVALTNVSMSNASTSATTIGGSSAITLASAQDFQTGQGIRVNKAGPAYALNAPTGLSAASTGGSGTTYTYTIAAFDIAGGVGAAVTTVTTSGGAALSGSVYNTLSWTAPTGTAPGGYAIYGNVAGSLALIGVVPAGVTTFNDVGNGATPTPDWLSASPQLASTADWLVTTIAGGGGTTSLTLAAPVVTGGSHGVLHDDTAAMQALMTLTGITPNYGAVQLPCGVMNITAALVATDELPHTIRGTDNCTTVSQLASQAVNALTFDPPVLAGYQGPSVVVDHLWFTIPAVPGATAIAITNESGAQITDNIVQNYTQGGWAYGVTLTTSYAPLVEHNQFYMYGNGVNAVKCGGATDASCNAGVVSRNLVGGVGYTTNTAALAFGSGVGFSVNGNDVENNYAGMSFANSHGVTVSGNDIESSTFPFIFTGVNSGLAFEALSLAGDGTMTLDGTTLQNSSFNNSFTYNSAVLQGTTTTVTGTHNTATGTGGISLPGVLPSNLNGLTISGASATGIAVGASALLTNGNLIYTDVQNFGTQSLGLAGGNEALVQNSADYNSAFLGFFKGRSVTKGSPATAVQAGDGTLEVQSNAADGTNFSDHGSINMSVDGSVGTNSIPTNFQIWLGNGTTGSGFIANQNLALLIDYKDNMYLRNGYLAIGSAFGYNPPSVYSSGTAPQYPIQVSEAQTGQAAFEYPGSTGGGAIVQAANGFSASVPIYAFWYNSNSGLGNPAANVSSIITNGVESFRDDANGHISIGEIANAPTLTGGCNGAGSSIATNATDSAGTVTGQTAAATSCTLTFHTAYTNTPFCVVSGQTGAITSYTPATSTLTVNFASTAGFKWTWVCHGT